jgi:hypothetical protein
MHPLLPATTARHRRDPTTRQRIRLSLIVLATIAAFAAIGVFGTRLSVQVRVVRWFLDRGIPLGFAGWALYAIPLCALSVFLIARPLAVRLAAAATLIGGVLAVAAMGRPRGLSSAQWKAELGPGGNDFVHAVGWAAYALLGTVALAVLAYLIRRPDHAGIRRLAAWAGLVSITTSLTAVILT